MPRATISYHLALAAALLAAGWRIPIVLGQDPAKVDGEKPAALPRSMAGFEDQGTLLLFLNEERLATIEYQWRKDGSFDAKTVLKLAGQSVTQTLKVTPDTEGRWEKIVQGTPLGPINVVRQGAEARFTFKDKVEVFKLKPGALIMDGSPTVAVGAGQVVRHYDRAKGGKQTFPVLFLPKIIKNVTVERKDTVERSVGGRDLKLTRFLLGLPSVDVTIWVDEAGKLYLVEVPAQHATFVREGYELLRQVPKADPLLSAPKHEVKEERKVAVPMRDGLKLSTDLYRPAVEGRLPVILIRTPYKKEMQELQARYYARRGYVVAVQDCRGRFGSPGVWEAFVNEKKDGFDTIEWLADQPWSNGKVGMIGGSYLGWVQWWAASQRPPHLVTIIPNVAPPDPFYNIPYDYGVLFLKPAILWAKIVESEATGDLSGATFSTISERKYNKLLRALPVIDLDKAVLGKENRSWRRWIEHNNNDDYWEQANFLEHLKDVRLPVFHQSGWFDGDGIGSKLNYLTMARHGHPYQKLVLGPWGHTDKATRTHGGRDFGQVAIIELERDYLRWFDYWLKGIENGITSEPLVSLFVMGSNRWVHGKTYPLPGTRFEKWYLNSGGGANTSKGDGRLSPEQPAADAPADRFTYDPGDPTPDPNDYEEPEKPTDKSKRKEKSVEEQKKLEEAYHDNITRARRDILVYQSEPLAKPLTFAGPVSATLHASTSARDTDWFMRLMEVDKAGKIFQLVEGKIRARFRRSTRTPELLKGGEVVEYTLDLWQTGITIPAGHRLRVEVASASFPTFSRNLNTGGHNEKETRHVTAEQAIYHNRERPSCIVLPVIDLEAGKR
jgi:putative CocE/NonD family hydrolase